MSNINIIGRRGLGKSTLALHVALSLNRNIVVFDPGDQFDSMRVRTSSLEQVRKEFERDNWDEVPLSLSYVPPTSHTEAEWDMFAETIWQYTGRHDGGASYVLIVDEADELQSPQKMDEWLNRFIRRSPRREKGNPNPVDIIQTTHNPQDLNRLSFSQSDTIFVFHMFDQRALKAISDQFGEAVAEKVQALETPESEPPGREVLEINATSGKARIISDPSEWFVRMEPPEPESDHGITLDNSIPWD